MEQKVFDIVVVGAGPGGMCAAIAAADQGASVVVLEALDQIGGNAVWSTGYLVFCNFEMQDARGLKDSEEHFMNDARAEVARQQELYGIVWDEALTRRYAQGMADTYRFLRRYGVTFERLIERPLQHTVHRMAKLDDTFALRPAFERAFAERNIPVVYKTRARRLLSDQGRVTGVRAANTDGVETDYIARRGVVLATGGYQANAKIRRRYQPEHLANTPYLGVETCRGDGHLMGQSMGGDLINMTMVQPLVMVASLFVEDVIAVNLAGERFHDEAGPYDDRVHALLAQSERKAFYIFDDATFNAKKHLVNEMPGELHSADSLAGLAAKLGCPAGALEKTVATWNAMLASDAKNDPLFGRVVMPSGRKGITVGPFHAARMVLGVNFPAGGFRTTLSMAVVDVHGDPVMGLYAAGDTVGGVNPCLGLGGIHISSAMTLGFVAGGAAARQETGSVHALPESGDLPATRTKQKIAIVHLPKEKAEPAQ